MMYCIVHEAFVSEKNIPFVVDPNCVLVTSKPPELDMSDAWVDSLPVPDAEELALMDKNADDLLLDVQS